MLVAVSSTGQRRVASAAARAEEVLCPGCSCPLRVRLPVSRVAHFAHPAGRSCGLEADRASQVRAARARAAQRRAMRRERAALAQGQEALFDL
jgi:hypothetical protein